MTAVARIVLEDCRRAHRLLEDLADPNLWRLHWFGALALLPAVNDVLHKVDCIEGLPKEVYSVLYKQWQTDPSATIFIEFISNDRNLAVHQYQFNCDLRNSIPVVYGDGEVAEFDQNIFRPQLSGWRAGEYDEDVRDIYAEAIDWWQLQLDKIDRDCAAF